MAIKITKRKAIKDRIDVKGTLSRRHFQTTLLVETAWEVCNQVGGIHTVIQTKVPSIVENWGSNYCLLGPYVHPNVTAIFDPVDDLFDAFGQAAARMREMGYGVQYGTWLVAGRPKAVLFELGSAWSKVNAIKHELWEHHQIPSPDHDKLVTDVVVFGHMVQVFFEQLTRPEVKGSKAIVGHFHEWMAGTAIPEIRRKNLDMSVVFTTHATMLGRYLAMNDPLFYEYLPFYQWEEEAKKFAIEPQVKIERAAAHGSQVFTTVSEVTGRECEHLLGKKVDVVTPNGLNVERFEALHEFQNLHLEYKEKIHQFVMGHFFQSYHFNLDNTLYLFTSGRYEYRNKGFDLTLEALAQLNYLLKEAEVDMTVIMFFITRQPVHSINPDVLQSRAVMEEIRQTCDMIAGEMKDKLFYQSTVAEDNRMPDLNRMVNDYLKLRLRRSLQTWKSSKLPPVVTHNLKDDSKDDILSFIRQANLINNAHDRVKIVYHPEFVSPTNPLFGMEYHQFVRGCHLGVFPSYYEPWGYTPLEAIASGIPAITSDLAGFGNYVRSNIEDHEDKGMFIIDRRFKTFDESAKQLAELLFRFAKLNRRQRITLRNEAEAASTSFGWDILTIYYSQAYFKALEATGNA